MNAVSGRVTRASRTHLRTSLLRVLGLALAGLCLSYCSSDNALRIDFSSKPQGVIIDVETTPDDSLSRRGKVHGELSAQEQFGVPCSGVIESTPAYTLRLNEAMPLRLIVRADPSEDLVVVLTGRYTTRCNDDFEGRNPGMQVYLQAGDYDVYVGTAQEQADPIPYELEVMPADPDRPFQGLSRALLSIALQRRDTWSSSANPQDIGELQRRIRAQSEAFEQPVPVTPPSLSAAPRYERLRIQSNLSGEIVSEGFQVRADAALWPLDAQCGGYVDTYGADFIFQVARGYKGGISCTVDANNEVEIAVRAPDGSWRCGGRRSEGHAVLEWEPWAAGNYRVFISASMPRVALDAKVVCQTLGD